MVLYVEDIVNCGQVYREFILCDRDTHVGHSPSRGEWFFVNYLVGEQTPEGGYDFGNLGLTIPGIIAL